MFQNTLIHSILAACIVTVSACDAIDDEHSAALIEQDASEEPGDRHKLADAPEELDPEAEPAWSELDLAEPENGAAGPPGKTCCVDCGDGWSGWYNIGTADNCNGRAATFCSQNYWYFINAEWRSWC